MKLDNEVSRERKVFYCLSGASWFLRILALLVLGVAVSLVCMLGIDPYESTFKNVIGIIAACLMSTAMILIFVSLYRKRIIFDSEQVRVKEDLKSFLLIKLQHAVSVRYADIESISISETIRGNVGKPTNMKYIVFHLKNEQKEQRINIFYFSNRQKEKIINEIYARMGKEFSEQSGKIL